MKCSLICWSYQRAAQLEMLLDSIRKYSSINFDINVLYRADDEEAEKSYGLVRDGYLNVQFYKEKNDFRQKTLELIYNGEENVCLACDDNVIVRPHNDITLDRIEPGTVFSLRLGFNTPLQDFSRNLYQPPLNNYILGNYLSWCPQHYNPNDNYGYPFACDFHIYNRQQLFDLANSFEWYNTNTLEGNLTRFRGKIYAMFSFPDSVSCCIPLNALSGNTIASQEPHHSVEYLNKQFSWGKRLRVLPGQKIIGAHQLLDVYWT